MQAVCSGAYSLSALLLAGALNPALAVGEFNPGAAASVTASTPPSIPNPTAPGGLSAFEGLLIFAPVILYGLFTVYRSKVNERAKVCPTQLRQSPSPNPVCRVVSGCITLDVLLTPL